MSKHPFIDKAIKNQRQPDALEYTIHCQIADYLNLVIKRPSRWHTVEVSNQASGAAAMFKQMALKRKGVVTGWPDIEIFWYPKGLKYTEQLPHLYMIFLEVKSPTGKLTERQEALHKELREDGHHVFVVRSVNDVESILKELGVI